jgi:hypothetical protein
METKKAGCRAFRLHDREGTEATTIAGIYVSASVTGDKDLETYRARVRAASLAMTVLDKLLIAARTSRSGSDKLDAGGDRRSGSRGESHCGI